MILIDLSLLAAGILVLAGCWGLWRFGDRQNIIYARLHMAGVIDVACIFLMFIVGQPLVALIYLILTPLSAHAIANARYMRGGFND